jgi:hypothetical protein
MISKEDIMATITCGSCKESHPTVNEVKLCFKRNNNFIQENKTKTQAPVAKSYKSVKTFEYKKDAEEFVKNTPNSHLNETVKVKRINVWVEETQSYETVVTKTYTVVIY